MLKQIDTKKKKIRIEKFKDTDMKRFIHNPKEQILEIKKLIVPKEAEILSKDLNEAGKLFEN